MRLGLALARKLLWPRLNLGFIIKITAKESLVCATAQRQLLPSLPSAPAAAA